MITDIVRLTGDVLVYLWLYYSLLN